MRNPHQFSAGDSALLQGRNLVGQAATGTGKTAAFALPVLERLSREAGRADLMALVFVPTRELAVQVSEAMHRYGGHLGVRVLPIYGDQPIDRQVDPGSTRDDLGMSWCVVLAPGA
jgi:ATP-dependent RNA helicase DeaD